MVDRAFDAGIVVVDKDLHLLEAAAGHRGAGREQLEGDAGNEIADGIRGAGEIDAVHGQAGVRAGNRGGVGQRGAAVDQAGADGESSRAGRGA